MDSKCDQIRLAWAAGDRISALRIAARFFDRSIETNAFKRGPFYFLVPFVLTANGLDTAPFVSYANGNGDTWGIG